MPPPTSLLTLFSGLSSLTVIEIMAGWIPAAVKDGVIIHHERSVGEVLYLIRSGRVTITTTKSSQTRGPGAIFGQMPDYGYELTGATVTAVEAADLLILSRVMVDHLRRLFPAVAARLPDLAAPED